MVSAGGRPEAGGRPDATSDEDVARRLAAALAAGRVEFHLQPIVDLPSGRTVALEALARWHDDELGPVPPDRFVAVAERTGLVGELGRRALHAACRDAASWADADAIVVNVNVSPIQLTDPDFAHVVADALASTGLAPARLCLEITEATAVEDLCLTDRRLGALRELGVQVALDDFGTGYSSLTVLRDLPVDVVKMDRAFVAHITSDARDAVLARLIVDAAHAMGMRVCAEGVETTEQARQLVALGCDRAQGWLFSAALRPDDPRLADAVRGTPLVARPITDHDASLPLAGSEELLLVTRADGRIAFASAAAVQLLGTAPGDLLGTRLDDHLAPADGPSSGAPAAGDGGSVPTDGTRRHEARRAVGGARRWLDVTTRVLRDDDGRPREALGVARDVTAVVNAELELAESEQRFRRAFDEAPIGMAMTTLEGAFLRVNTAFAAMLGLSPDDVMIRTVADLTVDEDLETDRTNLAQVRRGEADVHDVRKRYRHATGRPVPARVRAALVEGRDGAPPYLLAHVLPDVGEG
ncbi:EAL domain-containing protein [Actinotalea sp. AC32]|nr:EAL domain-containing protein [Actinotalea sp. AC32]